MSSACRRLLRCLTLAALLAPASAAWAAGGFVQGFPAAEGSVGNAHLAPHLDDDEQAYDHYVFEAYLDDGREVYWSARFYNLGLGDGKVDIKTRVEGGGGPKRQAKHKTKAGKVDTARLPVKVGYRGNELSGGTDQIRLKGQGKGFHYDITMTPTVPAWRPGGGRVKFAGGKYYDHTYVIPHGKVTGTVMVDGATAQVTGYGYGTHTHANIALHEQAKRWVNLRILDGDSAVHLREFTTPTEHDGESFAWLFVSSGGKVAVSTTDVSLRYGDFVDDAQSDVGYRVPRTLRVEAREGGNKVVIGLKGAGRYKRSDELAKMSSVVRAVAERFAKPVRYAWPARYQIRATGAVALERKGKGASYEITQLNP